MLFEYRSRLEGAARSNIILRDLSRQRLNSLRHSMDGVGSLLPLEPFAHKELFATIFCERKPNRLYLYK